MGNTKYQHRINTSNIVTEDVFEEHGNEMSGDEDSDGGDSGSDSGGEGSMNSAELFDDQQNAVEMK